MSLYRGVREHPKYIQTTIILEAFNLHFARLMLLQMISWLVKGLV